MCIQKITFKLNLPRKMNEFCIFVLFKKTPFWRKKYFLKTGFLTKILRVRFPIKNFKTCKILKQTFYIMSDFEIKILNDFVKNLLILKSHLSPPHLFITTFSSTKPCTKTAYNIFVHLDNSIRHRSNNSSCTLFRENFEFWFHCNAPVFSLDKHNTYRN